MLEQLKHDYDTYHGWLSITPIVVGTRGAATVEVIDFPYRQQWDEIAFEAWERMTYGGLNSPGSVEHLWWSLSVGREITSRQMYRRMLEMFNAPR